MLNDNIHLQRQKYLPLILVLSINTNILLTSNKNGEGGIRTLGTELPAVQQISNLPLSTTQPPLQGDKNKYQQLFLLMSNSFCRQSVVSSQQSVVSGFQSRVFYSGLLPLKVLQDNPCSCEDATANGKRQLFSDARRHATPSSRETRPRDGSGMHYLTID